MSDLNPSASSPQSAAAPVNSPYYPVTSLMPLAGVAEASPYYPAQPQQQQTETASNLTHVPVGNAPPQSGPASYPYVPPGPPSPSRDTEVTSAIPAAAQHTSISITPQDDSKDEDDSGDVIGRAFFLCVGLAIGIYLGPFSFCFLFCIREATGRNKKLQKRSFIIGSSIGIVLGIVFYVVCYVLVYRYYYNYYY
jgi:hypothetical protein